MGSRRPKYHRLLSLSVLLRRGHCAPAVMETILRARGSETPAMVKIAAGLPGGIGNTGYECGGITSPLILFGLDPGADEFRDGLPLALIRSQAHMRRFAERHSTLFCRDISQATGKVHLLPCVKAILDAPGIYESALAGALPEAGTGERRDAHRLLVSELAQRGFHCSRAVLDRLPEAASTYPELRVGMSAFIGGTACAGLTCSALTAGIMILGRRLGKIENSLPRVVRMMAFMKTGGDAFADRINAFNVIMNLGNGMARWFAEEFGDTQCRTITRADFSTRAGVRDFLDKKAAACEDISRKVAAKVEGIIGAAGTA